MGRVRDSYGILSIQFSGIYLYIVYTNIFGETIGHTHYTNA